MKGYFVIFINLQKTVLTEQHLLTLCIQMPFSIVLIKNFEKSALQLIQSFFPCQHKLQSRLYFPPTDTIFLSWIYLQNKHDSKESIVRYSTQQQNVTCINIYVMGPCLLQCEKQCKQQKQLLSRNPFHFFLNLGGYREQNQNMLNPQSRAQQNCREMVAPTSGSTVVHNTLTLLMIGPL